MLHHGKIKSARVNLRHDGEALECVEDVIEEGIEWATSLYVDMEVSPGPCFALKQFQLSALWQVMPEDEGVEEPYDLTP